MNLVLLFEHDFVESERRVRLYGRRLSHLREVHRAAPGDELRVGKSGGLTGTGRIVSLDEEAAEIEVRLEHEPPPPLPVTLILGLPRPKFLRRVIFSATVLGVKRIVLMNSYRVEKSYWQTPLLKKEQIERQLVLGLEQSGDTILPEVVLRPLFKPFVEDELPGIVSGTLALLADPYAVEQCPRGLSSHVVLAVGPEGGFIPYESEKLVSSGFRAVSLGGRILNVETAVPAILSRLF